MIGENWSIWTIKKRLLFGDIIFNLVPTVLMVYLFIKRSETMLINGGLITCFLGLVGIYTIVDFLCQTINSVYTRKIRSPKIKLSKYAKQWAIITGASSAVGSAFAFKFAKNGMNLCLIGRNEEKMKQMAAYITESNDFPNNIQVRILLNDFGSDDITQFHEQFDLELGKMIAQFKATGKGGIRFLVNCMNYRNEIPCIHHENSLPEMERMMKTNVEGALELVDAVLPYMKQQGPKHGSAIITVGSHSSHHPTPMMSLYSATNAYRSEMTKYYYEQYKDHGVHFLSVTPELMSSNMPRKRQNSAFIRSISAERIVNASVRNLGYQSEYFSFLGHAQSTIIPHIMWIHPWHRFLNKMKVARLEMLRAKKQIS